LKPVLTVSVVTYSDLEATRLYSGKVFILKSLMSCLCCAYRVDLYEGEYSGNADHLLSAAGRQRRGEAHLDTLCAVGSHSDLMETVVMHLTLF
jgi:hypothetical protein